MLRLVVLVGAQQKAFGDANRGRLVIYTAFSALLLIYAGSLAELDAEWSGPGVPVTFVGRLIAVMLMVGRISLIGVITASVAAWIIQRVAEQDAAMEAATAAQINELRSEIAQLTTMIAARHHDRGPDGGAHN